MDGGCGSTARWATMPDSAGYPRDEGRYRSHSLESDRGPFRFRPESASLKSGIRSSENSIAGHRALASFFLPKGRVFPVPGLLFRDRRTRWRSIGSKRGIGMNRIASSAEGDKNSRHDQEPSIDGSSIRKPPIPRSRYPDGRQADRARVERDMNPEIDPEESPCGTFGLDFGFAGKDNASTLV